MTNQNEDTKIKSTAAENAVGSNFSNQARKKTIVRLLLKTKFIRKNDQGSIPEPKILICNKKHKQSIKSTCLYVCYNEYMEIPLLQSQDWAGLQDRLGEKYFIKKGSNFRYLAILKDTPLGNYLYLPYGPVSSDVSGFKEAIKSLFNLATENNSIFIRIEPQDQRFIKYFPKNTKKTKDLNPKETWVLDLKNELDDKLPQRLVRYHKNAAKNGIKIIKSNDPNDIEKLITLQKNLAKKKGINTFSEEYLKTELAQPFATLYLVEYDNQETGKNEIIAAGLVFDDKTTRYNLQGAQSDNGRRLHATGILTIQLIKDAKEIGLKSFDFWGIAPEGAPKNHPWMGFTEFKKTFKGEQINYAGTYDIVLRPAKYRFYQLIRKINRLRRKV